MACSYKEFPLVFVKSATEKCVRPHLIEMDNLLISYHAIHLHPFFENKSLLTRISFNPATLHPVLLYIH